MTLFATCKWIPAFAGMTHGFAQAQSNASLLAAFVGMTVSHPFIRVRIKQIGFCAILVLSLQILPGFAEQPAYPELKTASRFSRTFQMLTGFTPVSGWVANRVLKHELAEHVEGNLHSRLKLFSGTDLLGRKVKNISISGKSVLVDDMIPLSQFRFENQSDMPLYVSKDRRPILLRPVVFKVSAVMTEADINHMLHSEKGRKMLTAMRVTVPPFGRHEFDALEPSVDINGDRLVIQTLMNIHEAPKENALPLTVSGRITPDQSRLALSDLELKIEGVGDTEEIAQLIEDYFSELVDFKKIKIDRHRVNVVFEKTELEDNQLNLTATLTVTPETKALKKYLSK